MANQSDLGQWWSRTRPVVERNLGVGSVLIGLIMVAYAKFRHPQAESVVVEIGIILLIAGLATIVVERARLEQYTRAISSITREKIDEIKTASIERVLRGVLPEQFFGLLSSVILEQKFLRENQRMDLTLTSRGDEYVKVSFSYRYRVTNRRKTEEVYPLLVAESIEDLSPEDTLIRYVKVKREGEDTFHVDIVDHKGRSPDGLYVQYEQRVPLAGDQSAQVMVQTERVERIRGEEPFFFLSPAQGLEIVVECPENINFVAEPIHASLARAIEPQTEVVDEGKRKLVYQFDLPILPYWCLIFHWKPASALAKGVS